MKKLYFLLVALVVTSFSYSQITELYFSKYAEGSSNNKFLEIYNGTSAAISLDTYAFPQVSNAPTVPGEYEFWNTFPAGATIAAGDVFVIAHPSADPLILAQADMTFNFLSNGDDGVALVNGGTFNDINNDGIIDAGEMTGFTVIDWLGDWNGDPGSGWEVAGVANGTRNHTLTRKTSVCGPNNDWDISRGTNAGDSEWIVGAIDTGWDVLGSYTGCQSSPSLTIASPGNGSTINATNNVDISFLAENFMIGAVGAGLDGHVHYTINGGADQMHFTTDPINIAVVPGNTYTVMLKLVDNNHNDIVPTVTDTVTFTVELPCDLFLNAIETTCDAFTTGIDTYTTTIAFTGGGTATYTLQTSAGIVGGDDPSTMVTGTITITGTDEGTDIVLTAVGDATTSCNITRNISSPTCVQATCAGVGSIIVTEIMKNPSAVADNSGEYFEVYNTTGTDIDMLGWTLKDDGSNLHTIATSVIVPANGYAVFGINADTATNGGVNVDYQYDNGYNLSNGADEVIIECSGTIIDAVFYEDTNFPDTAGESMELSVNLLNATDNDNGAAWCSAVSFIAVDADLGTPGIANDCSVTLAVQTNEIEGFSIYPNPIVDGKLVINTLSTSTKNVEVYSLLGKRIYADSFTGANTELNLSNLNTGIYILKVTEGSQIATSKLVVR